MYCAFSSHAIICWKSNLSARLFFKATCFPLSLSSPCNNCLGTDYETVWKMLYHSQLHGKSLLLLFLLYRIVHMIKWFILVWPSKDCSISSPVPIQIKHLLKCPGATGTQGEISFYWYLKLTCYSPYQISVVHPSAVKHIWIWFLRILLNFHQLATQSEQKQKQEKPEIVKNETSVPKQYAVMT